MFTTLYRLRSGVSNIYSYFSYSFIIRILWNKCFFHLIFYLTVYSVTKHFSSLFRGFFSLWNVSLILCYNYFIFKVCSISPVAWAITYDRFKEFNFLSPIAFSPFKLLLPLPSISHIADISSIWKPFEGSVSIKLYRYRSTFF